MGSRPAWNGWWPQATARALHGDQAMAVPQGQGWLADTGSLSAF
jgi:hypothetical protein